MVDGISIPQSSKRRRRGCGCERSLGAEMAALSCGRCGCALVETRDEWGSRFPCGACRQECGYMGPVPNVQANQNLKRFIVGVPTLAENARMGHPESRNGKGRLRQKDGPPAQTRRERIKGACGRIDSDVYAAALLELVS